MRSEDAASEPRRMAPCSSTRGVKQDHDPSDRQRGVSTVMLKDGRKSQPTRHTDAEYKIHQLCVNLIPLVPTNYYTHDEIK